MSAQPVDAGTTDETDRRRWIGLGVLAAGLGMIVLDGTIVGVALPRIISSLQLDLTDAQWVNSLYSMVFAALLLSFGRLGDRYGRRTIFVIGVVLFVLGSLTAAAAQGASGLIASRALQGVGGAMVLPATLSTVNATFRGKDRAVAFGVWGAVMAGMAALGPLLGGVLTTYLSWRWIFLVNLPIGAAILAATWFVVPQTRGDVRGPGIDVDGFLTSAIGLSLVVFGLIEGTQYGWWHQKTPFSVLGLHWPTSAPTSIVPVSLLVGLIFLALFFVWERHRAHNGRSALLDLSLFSLATFSWGNLTAMMVAVGEFALVFILPLFLVNVMGLSIMKAGLILAAMAIGAFISGAQARHLAARFGAPGVVVLGLTLEVIGTTTTMALVYTQASVWFLAGCMTIYGVGLGLASAQLTSTVLADVPTGQSGTGSATQSTVRQLGAALGSALAGTVLAAQLAASLPDQLRSVADLPASVAETLAASTSSSAGGILPSLRDQGTSGQLGPLSPEVIDVIARGFAHSAATSIAVCVAFLLLGLIGSIQLLRVSTRSDADERTVS